MSCRVHEIDLPGFLAAPRDAGWAEFRAHYPTCRECSAELRVWTELHRDLDGSGHPDPGRLAALAAGRERLPADERSRLERHLAGCAPCRDELGGLARFAPDELARFAPGDPASQASRTERSPGWLETLRGWVWSPAFAYALLAAFLVPQVYRATRVGEVRAPRPAEQRVIEQADREREDSVPRAAPSEAQESFAAKPSAPAPSKPEEQAGLAMAKRAAEGARSGMADEEAPVLDLGAEPRPVLDAARAREGLVLAAALPAPRPGLRAEAARDAPDPRAEMRIVSEDGRRELRERIPVGADGRIRVRVPPEWLRPGRYAAEVREAPGDAAPLVVLRFEVRP